MRPVQLLLAASFLGLGPSPHGLAEVPVLGTYSVDVTSFKARRFEGVVPQQYDYSCGSAAIATLLSHHFERPTIEREAFDRMWALGDQDRIRKEGFSLYEMKLYLEALGYKADGFRVPLDKVISVGVPVIVMIEIEGYKHFVVLKGIRDGWVLVGDPALGLKRWTRPEFEAAMVGDIVFAIHNADGVGRRYFNAEGEWALLPRGPFGQAADRGSLSAFSVMLPAFNEFY